MNDNSMPGPVQGDTLRQHQCASLESVEALKKAIQPDNGVVSRLRNKHVLSMKHFDSGLIRQILRRAACYQLGETPGRILKDKILSLVYFDQPREHSILAFYSAWNRLGGTVLDYDQCVDATNLKHYVLDELGEVTRACGDMVVLRTPEESVLYQDLKYFRVPVINAGNGEDEHPTHALSDLFTLFRWRPDLLYRETMDGEPLQIAIGGNPARTRTIRSFLYALAKFPWAVKRVVILEHLPNPLTDEQRKYLEDAGLKLEFTMEDYHYDSMMGAAAKVLPEMDVIYLHYRHMVHSIRMNLVQGIGALKPDALVLNPQIQNDQFARMLNDSPHNGYFAQLEGSVFIKMALFAMIFGR